MPPKLLVDFCSYEASRYAVEHWHYSKKMPVGKLVKIGVWEDDKFIGAVIFGRGANNGIGKPYGLKQTEVCELVRVALTQHKAPVSKIVSMAQRKLLSTSPGLRLLVSYADSKEGHNGGIYQAMNWVYVGVVRDKFIKISNEIYHPRSIVSKYGTRSIGWLKNNIDKNTSFVDAHNKYKYLYPLDRAMRKQIEPLAKPYPKRASG